MLKFKGELETEILKKLLVRIENNPAIIAEYCMPSVPYTYIGANWVIAVLEIHSRPKAKHLGIPISKHIRIECSNYSDNLRVDFFSFWIRDGIPAINGQTIQISLCDPDYEEQTIRILLQPLAMLGSGL